MVGKRTGRTPPSISFEKWPSMSTKSARLLTICNSDVTVYSRSVSL
jgi:hypothetical protein